VACAGKADANVGVKRTRMAKAIRAGMVINDYRVGNEASQMSELSSVADGRRGKAATAGAVRHREH
jgi:hypothetical protein